MFTSWPWLVAIAGGALVLGLAMMWGMFKARQATPEQNAAAERGARRLYEKQDDSNEDVPEAVAFRDGKSAAENSADVNIRPAGPESVRDRPEHWDRTDEASDESFPASDPPGRY